MEIYLSEQMEHQKQNLFLITKLEIIGSGMAMVHM